MTREWNAEKPGSYVVEIAGAPRRGGDRPRRSHLPPRGRRGGELPRRRRTASCWRSWREQTGGRYYTAGRAPRSWATEISYSEAGITTRETTDLWDMPVVFLLAAAAAGVRVAAAAKVGGGMKATGLALLLACVALPMPAATYYVTVAGLGGEPDYEQRFAMWGADIDKALRTRGRREGRNAHRRRRDASRCARRWRQSRARRSADDAFVLMLIGHGTFDGFDYKFNLPGPDITGARTGRAAGPRAGRATARGEHDQRQRRRRWKRCGSQAASSSPPPRPARRRTPRSSRATGRKRCATRRPIRIRTRASRRSKPSATRRRRPPRSTKRRSGWPPSTPCSTTPASDPKRRGQAGRGVPHGALRRQRRRRARPRQARSCWRRRNSSSSRSTGSSIRRPPCPPDEYKKQLTALLLELARTQEELDK